MKFSEVVNRVIELSRAAHAYWDVELPKRHPKYPLVDPDVSDPPPPPEEDELRQLLLSRPAEEVYKLDALSDVGNGVPVSDYEARWRRRMKIFPDVAVAIEGLIGKPLADGLTDGLAQLSSRHIDIDSIQPEPV
jgi:hypothetical protein